MALIEHDLIESIDKAPNPIVQCIMIFTATELCGSFLTGKTGKGQSRLNFLKFWKSHYIPTRYYVVSELLYDLLRNGVSHSFIPKGGIAPGADEKTSAIHLAYSNSGLIIYTPQLKCDVIGAIRELLKDLRIKDDLKNNYNSVIKQIINEGQNIYGKFIKDNNIEPIRVNISGDIRLDI